MKLNEQQAEAVVRLSKTSADFKLFLEAANIYRSECIDFAMYGQEDNVLTSRGMARAVTELLRAVGSAEALLSKLRGRNSNGKKIT